MATLHMLKPRRRFERRGALIPGYAMLALAAFASMGAYHAYSRVSHAPAILHGERFLHCGSGSRANCVIDGDTFYLGNEKIRIADIDAPETGGARCAFEAAQGARATRRLRELLNEGPFELRNYQSRDLDRYGRKLRVVFRDGRSLGNKLIEEGLARRWDGRRTSWCADAPA